MDVGSQETVEDFVTEAQKVAHTITNEALDRQYAKAQDQVKEHLPQMKKAEEMTRVVRTRQQSIADGAKGKKRAAEVAVERGGKSGKPSRKGKHLLAQNHCAIGWQ